MSTHHQTLGQRAKLNARSFVTELSDMIGYGDNEGLVDYLRLYIAIHGDHEGGNVSAHTTRE